MRAVAANALTLLVILGIVIVGAVGWGVRMATGPGPTTEPTVVLVPRGASLTALSTELEAQGVIRDARVFRMTARYLNMDSGLRYGEYETPAAASMTEVLEILVRGRPVQHFVTAPEGRTSWEIVELLRANEILTGDIDDVPPEGSLAPDTYAIQRGDTRAEVLARMAALQRRRIDEAWAQRAEDAMVRTPEEMVILASIIERETAVADERALVSGVFHNRLRRGMRLQSDPTIIYGITEGRGPLGRELTRADIDGRTAWNTYTIDGLPPTPIANPGRDALMAAARPEATDAYYFVADGTGGHAFARTLEEHNRNVAAWRAIERARRGN